MFDYNSLNVYKDDGSFEKFNLAAVRIDILIAAIEDLNMRVAALEVQK